VSGEVGKGEPCQQRAVWALKTTSRVTQPTRILYIHFIYFKINISHMVTVDKSRRKSLSPFKKSEGTKKIKL